MNYEEINKELEALISYDDYSITILSNASSYLNTKLDRLNWCGFYILHNDTLLLGPFQGNVACTKIKVGRGVCGTCIKENKTIVVKNVHEFSGHIACDSRSNSEICIPIYVNEKIYGLLDIDSPYLERFTDEDKAGLEKSVKIISKALENCFDLK